MAYKSTWRISLSQNFCTKFWVRSMPAIKFDSQTYSIEAYRLVFTVSISVFGNGVWYSVNILIIFFTVLLFWFNLSGNFLNMFTPVGWGCRIHWLPLCRRIRPPPQYVFNNRQSDGEAQVMLELCGMQSTFSLSSLPVWLLQLWVKWNCLTFNLSAKKWFIRNWIVRNRTVWSFNCV